MPLRSIKLATSGSQEAATTSSQRSSVERFRCTSPMRLASRLAVSRQSPKSTHYPTTEGPGSNSRGLLHFLRRIFQSARIETSSLLLVQAEHPLHHRPILIGARPGQLLLKSVHDRLPLLHLRIRQILGRLGG